MFGLWFRRRRHANDFFIAFPDRHIIYQLFRYCQFIGDLAIYSWLDGLPTATIQSAILTADKISHEYRASRNARYFFMRLCASCHTVRQIYLACSINFFGKGRGEADS